MKSFADLNTTNQKLEHLDKNLDRDEFVSMIGHELKTPVTVIKTHIQLLERKLIKAGELDYALSVAKMDNQLDKLTALINNLLGYKLNKG